MEIKYLGHASFTVTSDTETGKAPAGTRVQFDPYEPGGYNGALRYGGFTEPVDVVVISHEHPDHNYPQAVPGEPDILRGANSQVSHGIEFRRHRAYHDAKQGSERGEDIITVCEIDNITVCHVGDLGYVLSDAEVVALGRVDVLMVPVGGFFTIDHTQATQLMEKIHPRVCIPMHYKTAKVDFPIAPVGEFLKGKSDVKRIGASEVPLMVGRLPEKTEIWVLEPAL